MTNPLNFSDASRAFSAKGCISSHINKELFYALVGSANRIYMTMLWQFRGYLVIELHAFMMEMDVDDVHNGKQDRVVADVRSQRISDRHRT